MRIALDYDGTYTRDPAMWDRFIADAVANGHLVVCVTMRHPHEPIQMPCEVVYTGRKAKAAFWPADVYIDDKPHWLFTDSI